MKRYTTLLALAGLVLLGCAPLAQADSINFAMTGKFDVSVSQPDCPNPTCTLGVSDVDPVFGTTIVNLGDPWALNLNFTQGQFESTANVTLGIDGFTFTFANSATDTAGNPSSTNTMLFNGVSEYGSIEFVGSATAPLLSIQYQNQNPLDSSVGDGLDSGYVNLYMAGNAPGADDLLGASLTGDASAFPAFEFLNNYDEDPPYQDASGQTDLQGTPDAGPFSGALQTQPVSTTPELGTLWLLATGLLGLAGLMWRRRGAGQAGA